MGMALIIPIAMLYIGITKFDDCEASSKIPLWMIVVAVLMILERSIGSINSVKDRKFLEENPKPTHVEEGVDAIVEWQKRRKENLSKAAAFFGSVIRFVQFVAYVF
uniref:Neur_chan_memb domain-containing protein n=1 Tax=Caenorhabditis tropicalis TaxID=1561998 RepID=A0A1I7T6L4_9PELO